MGQELAAHAVRDRRGSAVEAFLDVPGMEKLTGGGNLLRSRDYGIVKLQR